MSIETKAAELREQSVRTLRANGSLHSHHQASCGSAGIQDGGGDSR